MASRIHSATTLGLEAVFVDVEADLSLGLPHFAVVGLPDTAVQEARERVRYSIRNSGAEFPRHKVAVNLAPGDVRKEGPSFDVPMALAILVASGQLAPLPEDHLLVGELSLDGTIRPIRGALPIAAAAQRAGFTAIVVPTANAQEAALVHGIHVLGVATLQQVLDHYRGATLLRPQRRKVTAPIIPAPLVDLRDVVGQAHAKRALEIAAAGGHNILLSGPPGSGKTMLAKALSALLPPFSFDEALEVTKIYSVAGALTSNASLIAQRPFRSPHHTASAASIVGGGRLPKPGEISLAHHGVLFLDEFPEFPRPVLEALREPLEEGTVIVSRIAGSVRFPADFIFVAAMNPCPCGYLTDPERHCTCSPHQVALYQKRISGPLLDRIDLHVHVPRLPFKELAASSNVETTATVRDRVGRARALQHARYQKTMLNKHLTSRQLHTMHLDAASSLLLDQAVQNFRLSIRAYHRVLKVARTIADLAGVADVQAEHIAEALQYRTRVE